MAGVSIGKGEARREFADKLDLKPTALRHKTNFVDKTADCVGRLTTGCREIKCLLEMHDFVAVEFSQCRINPPKGS